MHILTERSTKYIYQQRVPILLSNLTVVTVSTATCISTMQSLMVSSAWTSPKQRACFKYSGKGLKTSFKKESLLISSNYIIIIKAFGYQHIALDRIKYSGIPLLYIIEIILNLQYITAYNAQF